MRQVDLIPDELKTGHQRRRRMRLWTVLMGLALAAAGGLFSVRRLAVHREERVVAEMAMEAEGVQEEIAELREARDQLDNWKRRLALLSEVGAYGDFPGALEFLAGHTPELVCLDSLAFGEAKSAGGRRGGTRVAADAMFRQREEGGSTGGEVPAAIPVTLAGRAVSHEAVAEYLAILEQSGVFRGARLGHARRRQVAEGPVQVEFAIEAWLEPQGASAGQVPVAWEEKTEGWKPSAREEKTEGKMPSAREEGTAGGMRSAGEEGVVRGEAYAAVPTTENF